MWLWGPVMNQEDCSPWEIISQAVVTPRWRWNQPGLQGTCSGSSPVTAQSCPQQPQPWGINGFGSADTAQSLLTALMSSLNKKSIHFWFFWSWWLLLQLLAIGKRFFLPKTILVYEAKLTVSRNSIQETQKCSQLIYSYELFHHS